MKSLVAGLFAAGLTLTAGVARAELVTYAFTATITMDGDADNVLPYGLGDVVTGTFSYDTEAVVNFSGSFEAPSSGDYARYTTGSVNTGLTQVHVGHDDYAYVYDLTNIGSQQDGIQVIDYGTSTGGDDGYELVQFVSSEDAFSGVSLPTTLSLEDFTDPIYALLSSNVFVRGVITSLTKLDAASVPELSGGSVASAFFLLAGVAHLSARRRQLSVQHA